MTRTPLLALSVLLLLPRPAAGPLAYVSNERDRTISVIDVGAARLVATIPVPGRPRGIRVTDGGRTVLVALSDVQRNRTGSEDAIAVIDAAKRRVVARHAAGSDPEQFDVTPDGRLLVAANEDAGEGGDMFSKAGIAAE